MKTLAACLFTSLVAGCTMQPFPDGPVPTPPAPPAPETSSLTGVVEIDAPVAGAVVYLDANGNNLLDDGEVSTTTDATGHYAFTWPADQGQYAETVGAIVTKDALAVHLRAPITVTYQTIHETAVISPLTTLVTSEMLWNHAYDPAAAQAQLVAALKASSMPFSDSLDLMSDYTASSSSDAVQLRLLATALAGTISDAVKFGNAAQSHIDCNDNLIFTPAIAALDDQLTPLANAVNTFAAMTPAQRAEIQSGVNPSYFINASDLAQTIENELQAEAEDLAAELFAEIKDTFVQQFETDVVRLVAGELIAELL